LGVGIAPGKNGEVVVQKAETNAMALQRYLDTSFAFVKYALGRSEAVVGLESVVLWSRLAVR